MAECSIFVDESGGQRGHSKYYGITLVLHNQADDIAAAWTMGMGAFVPTLTR